MVTEPGEVVLVAFTLSVKVVEAPTETIFVGVEVVMVNDAAVVEMMALTFWLTTGTPKSVMPRMVTLFVPAGVAGVACPSMFAGGAGGAPGSRGWQETAAGGGGE